MKKNIFKVVLFAVLAAPAFTSCELDQYPTTSIPNEESWMKTSDAENFRNYIMQTIRSFSTQGYYSSDYYVDYFQPGLAFGNRNGQAYSWQFISTDTEGTWSSNYAYIANINNYINNCDGVSPKLEDYDSEEEYNADVKKLEQFKAEAYFARAWAYFNMAIRYCKDYEPETAGTDLGLPLVKEVDINAKPARATLEETFALIRSDIAEAQKLVNADEALGTDVVSPVVIKCLLARVALWMHDYQVAYDTANEIIGTPGLTLIDNVDDLVAQFSEGGVEQIFVPAMNPDERAEWSGTVFSFSSSSSAFQPDMIPAKSTIDAYDLGDIRFQAFFTNVDVNENDNTATVYLFNKFKNNPALNQQGDSPYALYNSPAAFRLPEFYLIAAEAAYRLNDNRNAAALLNTLRTSRNVEASNATAGDPLFNAIKNEWKLEYIGEGQRLFGLKRWHDGFTRSTAAQDPSVVYQTNPEKFIGLSITPDNYRWVWEIPSNDLETNKNLVPNWQ